MNALDKYIDDIKNNLSDDETTMIMQVYVDLGSKLRFDEDFYFGGSKMKKKLYFVNPNLDFINNSFSNGKITCKSSSYILNYVLKKLGVDIKVVEDHHTFKKYRHLYNVVTEKSGRVYSLDLQDDIMNIRYNARTISFGVSLDGKRYVVPLSLQKQIHKNIGYIDNCYYDDYLYTLKDALFMIDDYNSKVDFVLNNIDYGPVDVNYFERRWMHERIIHGLLNWNLENCLHTLELYRKDDESKEYINAYYLRNKNNIDIYMYSIPDNKYIKYNLEEYTDYSLKNNIESRSSIPGYRTMKNKQLSRKCYR